MHNKNGFWVTSEDSLFLVPITDSKAAIIPEVGDQVPWDCLSIGFQSAPNLKCLVRYICRCIIGPMLPGYKGCLPVVEIDRLSLLLKLKAAMLITNLILTLPCHFSPKVPLSPRRKKVGSEWMALHQAHVENTAEGHFCPQTGGLGLICVKWVFFVHSQPSWMRVMQRWLQNALKAACSGKLGAHNGVIFVRHSSPTSPFYCRNQNKSG